MEQKLRCVIVDDERHAVKLVKKLIINHPHLEVLKTYTDPLKALADIRKQAFADILFLDIEMPGIDGLQLAQLIRDKFQYLIFITSHAHFAVQSFTVRANQFLCKPITNVDFLAAISRLDSNSSSSSSTSLPVNIDTDDALYIQQEYKGRVMRIENSEIRYITPQKGKNYVTLKLKEEEHIFQSSLAYLDAQYAKDQRFMRINRSFIINLTKVIIIEGNLVKLDNGEVVSIGTEYREKLMNYLAYKLGNYVATR